MTPIEALILGFIQGLTEFFPISSSAHLKLTQHFLGMKDLHDYIFFDLICHLGTLFAVVFVLWRPIKDLFSANRTTFWQLCAATLPLFPLVLLMKPIRALFDQISLLGIWMIFNGLILAFAIKKSSIRPPTLLHKHRWRDTFLIGIAQACAIIPGISRSGSTISTAWLLGWDTRQAVTFSFLLSIPAVLGGIGYEILKLLWQPETTSLPPIGFFPYAIGFLTSFGVGWICFLLLIKLFTKEMFKGFAWYCILVGTAVMTYFNFFKK